MKAEQKAKEKAAKESCNVKPDQPKPKNNEELAKNEEDISPNVNCFIFFVFKFAFYSTLAKL